MKTKPIIFKAPMIQALLEGRKTQHRIVMKPQPLPDMTYTGFVIGGSKKDTGKFRWAYDNKSQIPKNVVYAKSPYKIGDFLYVKEDYGTISYDVGDTSTYDKVYKANPYFLDQHGKYTSELIKVSDLDDSAWFSASKMPRWASRLTLEITGIRVERLQDTSEEDASSEGVLEYDGKFDDLQYHVYCKDMGLVLGDLKPMYRQLWESINGKDSWEANPWVWVLDFIVHNKNIDEVINER